MAAWWGILAAMQTPGDEIHVVTRNRKARHEYEIVDSVEAGIELRGSEVKSIREGKVSLNEAYAIVQNGQVMLISMHINPYKMSSQQELDPLRSRRLLLHKKEIRKLFAKTEQKGMTLVPLSLYFKGKHAKIELGLGIGRKKYDKRQAIAEAEAKRRINRATQRDMKRPQ
jgi:SsrA-binding protein